MVKKIFRNIKREISAKKNIVGSISIAVMVVIVLFSSMLIFVPTTHAAYTDYAYSKLITIDNTKINQTLSFFPLWVYNVSDDFKDTNNGGSILPNGSDIAFFSYDNNTQYPHEIDVYNGTTGEIGIWVNVTSVSMSADTLFWIYYGDNDGGYGIGYLTTSVWHSTFDMVQHMNGEAWGDLDDSTSNAKDCDGENSAPTYNVTGKLGMSVEYDGDIDRDNDGDSNTFEQTHSNTVTVSNWVYADLWNNYSVALVNSPVGADYQWAIYMDKTSDLVRFYVYTDDWYNAVATGYNYTGEWAHLAGTYDGTSLRVYINGDMLGVFITSGAIQDANVPMTTSSRNVVNGWFDGKVDEIQVLNQAMSSSWINASFLNQNDPSTFLTFGEEAGEAGESASSYEIRGLPNDIITWSGLANTIVWCNSSGETNEWLEVNMSINASTNVTELRVWVGDLNNSGSTSWINATNITLYVSSDNVSYASYGTFTDSGGNITINESEWVGGGGDNPFTGAGLTDTNASIYLLFRLSIPSTVPTDTFWSVSATEWKIYIGYT